MSQKNCMLDKDIIIILILDIRDQNEIENSCLSVIGINFSRLNLFQIITHNDVQRRVSRGADFILLKLHLCSRKHSLRRS